MHKHGQAADRRGSILCMRQNENIYRSVQTIALRIALRIALKIALKIVLKIVLEKNHVKYTAGGIPL